MEGLQIYQKPIGSGATFQVIMSWNDYFHIRPSCSKCISSDWTFFRIFSHLFFTFSSLNQGISERSRMGANLQSHGLRHPNSCTCPHLLWVRLDHYFYGANHGELLNHWIIRVLKMVEWMSLWKKGILEIDFSGSRKRRWLYSHLQQSISWERLNPHLEIGVCRQMSRWHFYIGLSNGMTRFKWI